MYKKLFLFTVILAVIAVGTAKADPNLIAHWKFDMQTISTTL